MNPRARVLVVILSPLILCAGYQVEGLGAQTRPKDQASTAKVPTASELPAVPRRTAGSQLLHESMGTARGQKQLKGEGTPSPADSRPIHRKVHKKAKARKQTILKAVVQPRQELRYHGVLEDPQRYDPRLNAKASGVPNPQTPELIHDHFRELDRNQDGLIDPVERAVGRLDIDRDLDSHRPR